MTQKHILHKGDAGRAQVLANLHAFLDRLPDTQSWSIEVKRYVKERTDPQNRALFGVAYPILRDHIGTATVDELHLECCERFFGTVDVVVLGRTTKRPYRTTTTGPDGKRDVIPWDQFSAFYAMVQQIGAELGLYIPEPEKQIPEHAR